MKMKNIKSTSFVLDNYTLCFFLNQQFITQSIRADCGSYFCNYIQKIHTYMKKETRKRHKIKIGRTKKN